MTFVMFLLMIFVDSPAPIIYPVAIQAGSKTLRTS